ncbi:gamma-butyrobetaine hydroxylase-like domain-containing protein [Methylobacter sp.]|jgi:DUF971 family protein|uniref:gamma-butyrobetaine hydroxylase-like domain-containing protein n=1 Tax=Methylobacter sp. TaxID=2051955 RepID=UPI003DA442AB
MRLTVPPCHTIPTEIKLHQVSRLLEISFDDGSVFKLPYEYLRVYTPSAEAVGHAPGQEVLQVGKEDVTIAEIKPVGNYGIAPVYSDGHNTGIYTWDLLYKLGAEYPALWADYLQRLEAAGHQRKASPLPTEH